MLYCINTYQQGEIIMNQDNDNIKQLCDEVIAEIRHTEDNPVTIDDIKSPKLRALLADIRARKGN